MNTKRVIVYGANWCPDCRRTNKYLRYSNIEFEYILVDEDPKASAYVMELNNGKRVIPTLVVDDEVYSNPSLLVLSTLFETHI